MENRLGWIDEEIHRRTDKGMSKPADTQMNGSMDEGTDGQTDA